MATAAPQDRLARTWPDQVHGLDPRPPRRGRHPRGGRALGRRSRVRDTALGSGDVGRPRDPLHDVVALADGYRADAVATALIDHLGRLPESLRRSLTWDRGREMAAHAAVTAALSMPVYFCDPHHAWQRGTNENTNRLLRQYLPRNADLSTLSQHELDAIAAKLHHRPRRVLDWATPGRGARRHRTPPAPAGTHQWRGRLAMIGDHERS
ncbi:IS30 family transposase [Nocardia sp. NPDC050697]|uniref:IS30 family transposase n=1 Tax=Nocardia sp. NPDC050697 TaxID=3155158 RepID=UPI0033DD988B